MKQIFIAIDQLINTLLNGWADCRAARIDGGVRRMKLTDRLLQSLIAFDQFANTLLGSGWADETLSAYSWRTRYTSPWRHKVVDALLFWDRDHCKESYASELERQQLPTEYRIVKGEIP